MKKLRTEIIIHAPAEMVWETIFDEKNTNKWSTMLLSYKMKDNNVTLLLKMGKRIMKRKAYATSFVKNETFGWTGSVIAPFVSRDNHQFTLEKLDDHTTKFIQTDEIRGILQGFANARLYKEYDEALKKAAELHYLESKK